MMNLGPEPRRLVLLLDGTWNRREHTTNIWRMRLLLEHSPQQLVYYDEGVGTEQFEKIRGGALGTGLSRKVLAAYLWLMENYCSAQDSPTGVADDVFIFGFSRGAFTARSLAGFLGLCGLVRRDAPVSILSAHEMSKTKGATRAHRDMRYFRLLYSIEVPVKFLGVWDTVGALGVPKFDFPFVEKYEYHKAVELHDIVQHARHALALDEHRKLFEPTLFPAAGRKQTLEQRWFTGSHANVGGGYDRDGLFLRPLQWMVDEAERKGLRFRTSLSRLSNRFYRSLPRNSLGEIALGSYYLTQGLKRFDRTVAFSDPTVQTLDYTVIQRWLWHQQYDPPALRGILGKKPTRGRVFRISIAEICARVSTARLSSNPDHKNGFIV
jgi:uncharacterized protein (DUF2235 family)